MPKAAAPCSRPGISAGELGRQSLEVGFVIEHDLFDFVDAVVGGKRFHEVEADDILDRADAACDREDRSDIKAIIDVDGVAAERCLHDYLQRLPEIVATGDLGEITCRKRKIAADQSDAPPESDGSRIAIAHAVTKVWGSLIVNPGWRLPVLCANAIAAASAAV